MKARVVPEYPGFIVFDDGTIYGPSRRRLNPIVNYAADRIVHGASNRGETNGSAKLNATQVADIRARYTAGGATHASLALEYGVSRSLISQIIRREIWSHVG